MRLCSAGCLFKATLKIARHGCYMLFPVVAHVLKSAYESQYFRLIVKCTHYFFFFFFFSHILLVFSRSGSNKIKDDSDGNSCLEQSFSHVNMVESGLNLIIEQVIFGCLRM